MRLMVVRTRVAVNAGDREAGQAGCGGGPLKAPMDVVRTEGTVGRYGNPNPMNIRAGNP